MEHVARRDRLAARELALQVANHRRNQLDFVMDPLQSIAVATHLIDAIRKAREVAARVKDAEVQAILLDAQERALNLKEELVTLRAENIELREQLTARTVVEYDSGAYFAKTEAGRDGPFCTRCYDVDRRLVRMKQNQDYWHHCPQCDKNFEVKSVPPRPRDPVRVSRG